MQGFYLGYQARQLLLRSIIADVGLTVGDLGVEALFCSCGVLGLKLRYRFPLCTDRNAEPVGSTAYRPK